MARANKKKPEYNADSIDWYEGKTLNMLTISSGVFKDEKARKRINAICVCGVEKSYLIANLRNGSTKSCGCHRQKRMVDSNTTHGMSRIPEYSVYRNMIARCHDKSDSDYPNYGAKGHRVCSRWRKGADGKSGFECFIEDMGRRPSPKHQLEKDALGKRKALKGYSPETTRWATCKVNNRHRSSNRKLAFQGRSVTIARWGEITGFLPGTIRDRLSLGWSIKDALTKPLRSYPR